MLTLTRLVLTDFRTYASLTWRPADRIAVITGPNGSGKTNLLEAIAMLSPGRGFGRSRLAEMARRGGPGTWTVAARLGGDRQQTDIGTGLIESGSERRVFRLDGAEPRSQAELTARLSMVWLTPQMDTLFAEGPAGRRRFLDRLVWALEPGHAREASAHDSAMAERRRVLAQARQAGTVPDPAWLAGLEQEIARHAVALAAARAAFVGRLNAAPAPSAAFPRAAIALDDPVADRLAVQPALATEAWLTDALARRRPADMAAGTSTLGAHRADMRLSDADTGLQAQQASTGQCRAMLIGVLLAHAALIAEASRQAPLLLLDEPAVHLDARRRDALWETLAQLHSQVFLTGTDSEVFAALRNRAEFMRTQDGTLLPA